MLFNIFNKRKITITSKNTIVGKDIMTQKAILPKVSDI